ncbi:Hydantoinase/oxoprolinase-domain-containing protein [Leptodontidium sp. MPI-SDFR-AT-0119]|nr:Hydantoinase/oxoprolinase-domain-containing protein [Leptodontidium sp. MPI-SDFR-AT-0119]
MGDAGSMKGTGYRLGVDVGGTFTDVCVFTPEGKTVRTKVPSTSHDQSIGVKNGILKAREELKSLYGWDGQFESIHHGTTVGTNAVLEGKGARTALVVTSGHKDVLSVRRSQIPGGLGAWINFVPPPPIVPLESTAQSKLREDLAHLKKQKPEAVTISLLNSYQNAAHEQTVAKILREELGPDVEIVCSADVLPEVGEYERTVTASANAIVKPVVKKYLANLSMLLKEDSETIRILKSDGGLTTLDLAGELPVNILMSGPAGGVRGVADVVAKKTKYRNLITLDMGGTSTDCALISNGSPALRRETAIDSLTVRAPSVDVQTVGAGGGSIAQYVELTSTLRVGPESSGANPGPTCYGKGGTNATVTDANVVLGYLPDKLLGGAFPLDISAATAAVERVAGQMGLSTDQTAQGIYNLVNERMYNALRIVSVEQGYNPEDFSLVAFGGAGPLHANAVGKLLGAWPVIIPPAPGVLCAQGDATTKLSHEQSASYIKLLTDASPTELWESLQKLKGGCSEVMFKALGTGSSAILTTAFEADLRYKGQALTLSIPFLEEELKLEPALFVEAVKKRFDAAHEQQFSFSLPSFALEIMRLGAIVTDGSPDTEITSIETSGNAGETPPDGAIVSRKMISTEGERLEAIFWDRAKISKCGYKVNGPCVISEMDSNTLILPGFYGEIDSYGNILIHPHESTNLTGDIAELDWETAQKLVNHSPLIPTLISSSLQSIRNEMDTLMLRCSMSPAIRDQQDEFNVITNKEGKMLVGRFGSFIGQFLGSWKGTIEEGDVFVTNDVYEISGAVTHLNDVIVLLPIHYKGDIVGWAANFGHMTDVGGKVPGSMSINATSIFEDGLQIPTVKLYSKGTFNSAMVDVFCRNSRQPDWFRSDLTALVAACRTAATRVCELNERFGPNVYTASCNELLARNRSGIMKLIDTQIGTEPSTFTDFVDDDGQGVGPYAITCTMQKKEGKLVFDFSGTSPQSQTSINFYLSTTMFKMFVGYYLLAVFDPFCVVNDRFHDLLDIITPEGSLLRPVRPAALSCRTHFLGRTMDIIQALMGQRSPEYRAAAGFSDSPHFFYSGFKPNGEWYQLYQIGFGGVPARPIGDGPDCHCLFPAIKSVPTEFIELNFPLRIEANESLADTGGAGFYRGGNAQRTLYRFLSAGEFSIHDDRWFTKPWGINGGSPGARSFKKIYRYSSADPPNPKIEVLPSKCDHIRVQPNDLLEWVTWGGGGLGDPTTRPAEIVAMEVARKLVTVKGAKENYGVIVDGNTFVVDEGATKARREEIVAARTKEYEGRVYDRGGTLAELTATCLEETGLPPPKLQWEKDPYGLHVALPYVKEWYKTMREKGDWDLQ